MRDLRRAQGRRDLSIPSNDVDNASIPLFALLTTRIRNASDALSKLLDSSSLLLRLQPAVGDSALHEAKECPAQRRIRGVLEYSDSILDRLLRKLESLLVGRESRAIGAGPLPWCASKTGTVVVLAEGNGGSRVTATRAPCRDSC
jgi:hypothetical protein